MSLLKTIIEEIIESHLLDLLNIIHQKYPEQFTSENINEELKYIIDNIELHNETSNTSIASNTTLKKNKTIPIHMTKPIPMPIPDSKDRCNARIWGFIYNKNSDKINTIESKYKVTDYNDINGDEFTDKYIVGKQCKSKKINGQIYCKKHKNHLPHGNFLEKPSNELILHYLQDGKYI